MCDWNVSIVVAPVSAAYSPFTILSNHVLFLFEFFLNFIPLLFITKRDAFFFALRASHNDISSIEIKLYRKQILGYFVELIPIENLTTIQLKNFKCYYIILTFLRKHVFKHKTTYLYNTRILQLYSVFQKLCNTQHLGNIYISIYQGALWVIFIWKSYSNTSKMLAIFKILVLCELYSIYLQDIPSFTDFLQNAVHYNIEWYVIVNWTTFLRLHSCTGIVYGYLSILGMYSLE